jgi:hypothetical protein
MSSSIHSDDLYRVGNISVNDAYRDGQAVHDKFTADINNHSVDMSRSHSSTTAKLHDVQLFDSSTAAANGAVTEAARGAEFAAGRNYAEDSPYPASSKMDPPPYESNNKHHSHTMEQWFEKEMTKAAKHVINEIRNGCSGFYTTKDQTLSGDEQLKEVGSPVEHQKKQEQAERLSPSTEQINAALTPDVKDQLQKAGLNVDGDKLHEQIAARMEADNGLSSAAMEKMKQFPVGAPYVALGAVSGPQMDAALKEQTDLRDNWKKANSASQLPNVVMQQTDVGALLRKHAEEDPQHYNIAKIDAADALIEKLQKN